MADVFDTMLDVDLLARLIYGEARGEGATGKAAVAHVALNRAAKPGWWGKTLREVILKPYQFSCFNVEYRDILIAPTGDTWLVCQGYAHRTLSGEFSDPTHGATHFYADTIAAPSWAASMTQTAHIGHHIFLKAAQAGEVIPVATNPLDPNCQGFKTDAQGRITGIELGITKVENAKYEVYSVRMRDENEAAGQTIAVCSVLDLNGINTGQQVRLTWPGATVPFQDSGLPGNANSVHIITNGFSPPKLGPLALHVGGFNAPISDIVYGFGLPYNRHVSFDVVFREKSSGVPPVDPTDPTTDARITALVTWAKAVSAKYPSGPQFG